MFNSTLPEHSLSATRILYLVSKSAPIQTDLVTLFTEDKVSTRGLGVGTSRWGGMECRYSGTNHVHLFQCFLLGI